MSNEVTQEQVKEAHEFLHEQLDVPAFFDKLKTVHGIEPRTEKEASQLYELGALLAQQEAEEYQKKASTGGDGNPFLDYALSRIAPQGASHQQDAQVKQAASNAVKSSDLCKTAALVFAHHLASNMQTQNE